MSSALCDWLLFIPLMVHLKIIRFMLLLKVFFAIRSHFVVVVHPVNHNCRSVFFCYYILISIKRIIFQAFLNHIEYLFFLFLLFKIYKYFSFIYSNGYQNLRELFVLFLQDFLICLLLLNFTLILQLSISFLNSKY
jgi:hypothetical protein